MEEACTRFSWALMKAAHITTPRAFIPCLDAECSALLKVYEDSRDPDVADHLIDSLN